MVPPPSMTLGELYDAEAAARIESGPRGHRAAPGGRSQPVAAGALVVAIGLGIGEVLDPKPQEPVVADVDPTDAWRHERIRITGMELGPRHTVAWVRPAG
ncbi:MAG TPA: hypothetical protein VMW08_02770 [Acidimicrobiales bacterium]|nr:hypothetical protein [Acidimicrobiales bacterium]